MLLRFHKVGERDMKLLALYVYRSTRNQICKYKLVRHAETSFIRPHEIAIA